MKQRIKAIDVMRGLTIAGMILVNNPGSWGDVYAPLLHAEFNGMTPTDLVFPFFMFIMGVCTYLSLSKGNFTLTRPLFLKIVRRTLLLFLIGLLLNLIIGLLHFGSHWLSALRYMGVMQRLGVCYGITALLALTVNHKYFPHIIGFILVAYSAILLLGNGFVYTPDNVCCRVYTRLMEASHLYLGDGWPFDPEGWMSTPAAVTEVIIGFLCGKQLLSKNSLDGKMLRLLIVGFVMMICGWLLSYGIPLNKKVWSPTFVLMSCGMAMSLLALMIWTIDMKGVRYTAFFNTLGANPLFIFVVSEVMSIFMFSGIFQAPLASVLPAKLASLCSAAITLFICWLIVLPLYKKHIYIKI